MRVPLIAAIMIGTIIGFRWSGHPAPAVQPQSEPAGQPHKTVLERNGSHFSVVAQVNGVPVQFVVDTGADITALTREDADRAHIPYDPAKFVTIARTASGMASGQEIHIGRIDLDGKVRDDVGGIVLDGLHVSLLGQNFLRRLESVQLTGDKMVLR